MAVPDADWDAVITTLLQTRARSLGLPQLNYRVVRHPERDPGIRTQVHELLRAQQNRARFALAILDLHGSGSPLAASRLEAEIADRLARNGWSARCAVICADPELERWVWSGSPHVETVLGWRRPPAMRAWLEAHGLWSVNSVKPGDPEAALVGILRRTGKRPSPALFGDLAARVGLDGCSDEAFNRFRTVMGAWFS